MPTYGIVSRQTGNVIPRETLVCDMVKDLVHKKLEVLNSFVRAIAIDPLKQFYYSHLDLEILLLSVERSYLCRPNFSNG